MHLSERSGRDSLGRLVCGVFGEVDGIHKLHHGRWVLIPVGTHSLRYDTIKKEIVTTFRPWCFLFAKSESIAMVAGAFKALQETSLMLWGHEFTLNTCCIDHSDSLKTGVESTNPFASVVTCWPHFSRKYREKQPLLQVRGEQKREEMLEWILNNLRAIHLSKTFEQAAWMCVKFGQDMTAKGEYTYYSWLEKEYFCEGWLTWFVAASGYPGALPNNNPIEANNNKIKGSKIAGLRASTAYFLNKAMPRMLYLDGLHMVGNTHHKLDLVPAGSIDGAHALLVGLSDGEQPIYHLTQEQMQPWLHSGREVRSGMEADQIQTLPLSYLLQNSCTVLLINNSENVNTPITFSRVAGFLDLLQGYLARQEPSARVARTCLDFHKKVRA